MHLSYAMGCKTIALFYENSLKDLWAPDERIYNNDLAQQRADYELFLHARMNDSITLEIVPLYWLNDVNIKIAHTNKNVGINMYRKPLKFKT